MRASVGADAHVRRGGGPYWQGRAAASELSWDRPRPRRCRSAGTRGAASAGNRFAGPQRAVRAALSHRV